MFKEFKEFALRGSVVDLAIGIVIGGAFGSVVNSLVNDIMMPPIGLLLGKVDFSNLFIDLTRSGYETLAAAQEAGAATLNYGMFINTVINFIIMALAMFLVIKGMNRLQRDHDEAPADPTTKDCPHCFTTISIKATRCPNCTTELG